MTEADARYAVELLDARGGLADVRTGLGLAGEYMALSIVALEDNCTHRGTALFPVKMGLQVVAFAEDLIRRELRALKVTPEGEIEPGVKNEGHAKGPAAGGAARAAALSPSRRSEIARTAASARWAKTPNNAPPTGAKQ